MKILKEEAEQIVTDNHFDWDMIEENIVDQRRWVTVFEGIFKHKPSEKYYRRSYERGSTENQDSEYFYGKEIEFQEVEQKEVLTKVWVNV
jgi:hypothetical protein